MLGTERACQEGVIDRRSTPLIHIFGVFFRRSTALSVAFFDQRPCSDRSSMQDEVHPRRSLLFFLCRSHTLQAYEDGGLHNRTVCTISSTGYTNRLLVLSSSINLCWYFQTTCFLPSIASRHAVNKYGLIDDLFCPLL